MKVVTRDGKRELVPMMSETTLGARMYDFEATQCLLGLRGPLPNTPILTKAMSADARKDVLRGLYFMYGDVTPELLDICMDEAVSATWKNRYLKNWKEMQDENSGSV